MYAPFHVEPRATLRTNLLAGLWAFVVVACAALIVALVSGIATILIASYMASSVDVALYAVKAVSALFGGIVGGLTFLLIVDDWRGFRNAACPPKPVVEVQAFRSFLER